MAGKTFAGGSRFAHLLGRGKKSAAAKAEDTDDEDEKARKAKKAESGGDLDDPDENEDEKKDKLDDSLDEHTDDDGTTDLDDDEEGTAKKAKGKKASAGDDDEDSDAKKAKQAKAKAEDGDDETDDKDEKDAKASAARSRERARCAAIFASPAAAKRPDFAAHLAFGTKMNRGAAVEMLEAAAGGEDEESAEPKPRRSLRQRMDRAPSPDVGPDGGRKPATGAAGFAAEMKAVNAVRHGTA